MRLRPAAFLSLLLLIPAAALAQTPDADWRTIETERFRIHYPAPWEEWTVHAARRLENVRDRVEESIGWTIEEKVDVVVMDPVAQANGMALPLLGWPRIVLWTSPPQPQSVIGMNRGWLEIVAVHEVAHLAHLLRPSRSPWRRLRTVSVPIGPIALAPRWVSEGYATVIEGDLTGSGRPNSDFRASVLREWARAGRLPSYAQLHGDSGSWLGMSMAYLVGSAYLEWLREREGPDSLENLWARMTARADRNFDEAFAGVFGDSPSDLYRRFSAELTASAIEIERTLEPTLREGELWQNFTWSTGEPVVSPDGDSLVTILRSRAEPSRIVIVSTGPNSEAEESDRERLAKLLERDPLDVAPVRRIPLPRKPLHELHSTDGAEPYGARWMPDGDSILFVRFEPDAAGMFHPDLFRWHPEQGELTRVTRLADVRDPDPSPDGRSAVAVRNRHGFSELVTVDLSTGAVDSISPPSIETVYVSPRWSRDGSRLAHVRHERNRWRLFVREGLAGTDREIFTEEDSIVFQPSWGADATTLFASVGSGGFVEIHRFDLGETGSEQLTRSVGASFAPTLSPDGDALFYLSIDSDGLDLRRLELSAPLPPLPRVALDAALAPAIRPPTPERVEPLAEGEIPRWRPYGIGRQELRLHLGGGRLPSNQVWEAGLRVGDLIGRLDTVATAAFGGESAAERGYSLASAWRGWPVEVRGHLFSADQELSAQPGCEESIPGCSGARDLEREGAELALAWDRRWRTARLAVEGGALWQSVSSPGADDASQQILFVEIDPSVRRRFGKLRIGGGMLARQEAGQTESSGWSRTRMGAGGEVAWSGTELALAWNRNTSDSIDASFDRYALGGMIGSIFPRSALSSRIEAPALPAGIAFGEEHESQKASLAFDLPLRAFYEKHRLWDDGAPKGSWVELAGLEANLEIAPQPLLRVPALELRLGAARILEGPLRGDTTWWISTGWRP